MPENLYEYDEVGYSTHVDYVLRLINWDFPLNEEEYTIHNVEQFINESANEDEYIIESGFVVANNNKYYYHLLDVCGLHGMFAWKVNKSNQLAPLHFESVGYFK